jgi:hypothetical protein
MAITPPDITPIQQKNQEPVMCIKQPYTEAESFTNVLDKTPGTVAEGFRWANHLIAPRNIAQKFDAFAVQNQFPVDGKSLTQICLQSFGFCDSVYNKTLFPPGAPRLPYHDLNHGLITSITAQKIFLGGLAQEEKNGKIKLAPKERVARLHALFSLVSSFHEIDDWWNLPYPGTEGKENPYIEQAKDQIVKHLTTLGLSAYDFNRLLVLDDFRESQDACLKKSIELKPEDKGFLKNNNVPSLLDSFLPDERECILTIASKGLCAGDFLQVINPAYIQPINMNVDGHIYEGHAGPFVLADEMSKWRPNALVPPGFGNPEDRTVYWDKVKLTLGFFEGVALPRINSGLDYLGIAAPTELYNARLVITSKIAFLRTVFEKSRKKEKPEVS